ncbi:MAG TPA: DUF559 domain-containing protein [Lysobacter sp.]|nr:DUF559 domain-containing protein [Lysobacter sp.]
MFCPHRGRHPEVQEDFTMRGKQDHSRQHGLRRQQTPAELALWQQLRGRRLRGWKFRRQHRIGPYFADFVCLQARLAIELDGSQHAERIEHDLARTRFLEQRDFRVLRYWNDAVFLRLNDVLEDIANALDARQCPSSALRAPSPRERGEGRD